MYQLVYHNDIMRINSLFHSCYNFVSNSVVGTYQDLAVPGFNCNIYDT